MLTPELLALLDKPPQGRRVCKQLQRCNYRISPDPSKIRPVFAVRQHPQVNCPLLKPAPPLVGLRHYYYYIFPFLFSRGVPPSLTYPPPPFHSFLTPHTSHSRRLVQKRRIRTEYAIHAVIVKIIYPFIHSYSRPHSPLSCLFGLRF